MTNKAIFKTGATYTPIIDASANTAARTYTMFDYDGNVMSRDINAAASSAIDSIVNPLSAGVSAALTLLGDSTANDTTEWFYRLLSEKLGPAMPNVHIRYWLWNDSTQKWNAPTTIQNGVDGQRYAVVTSGADTYRFVAHENLVARSSADIELQIKVQADDWTPAANRPLVTKSGSAGNLGWQLWFDTTGVIRFLWSTDGTATTSKSSSAHNFVDGNTYTIRVKFDVDNGAGGYSLIIETSADDGANWTSILNTGAGLGTTAVYESTGSVGIGGSSGIAYAGRIYEVFLRDGIGGPDRAPVSIEAWRSTDSNSSNANSLGGSPTLYVFNGSVAGKGISYLSDSTRLPKMTPISPVQALMISTGHNDQAYGFSHALATAVASWVTALKARLPAAPIIFLTQSPRDLSVSAGKLYGPEVNQLHMALRQLAERNGCACIDTYAAFTRAINGGTPIGSLVADGVHPTADGYTLWMDEVWKHVRV